MYPSFDLFSDPPPPNITPFQQKYVRDFDWKSSALGPVETWVPQLRQMVTIVQKDDGPCCIYWDVPGGPDGKKDVVIVYNEAYTHLIGQKHPSLQGTDPKYGFAEVWDQFAKLLETGRQNGNAVEDKNALLLMQRHGFLEESYFSWKFIPVVGPEGYIVGSFATVVEVTQEILATRRLATIQRLGQLIASSKTSSDLWARVVLGLEANERDVPLALVYSVVNENCLSFSPVSSSRPSYCRLEGTLGVERNHEIAPSVVDLSKESSIGWASAFNKAIEGDSTYLVLTTEDGSLSAKSLDGINWRGFGIPSGRIVVCPIRSSSSTTILGFLVIALNPRLPFDQEYKDWIDLLMTSMAAPRIEAILAAEDSAKLSEQLELRTKDLQESEERFLRFATRSTVAIIIVKPNGELMFGNTTWSDLVNGVTSRDAWINAVVEEDRPICNSNWQRMLHEKVPVKYQCRFDRPWTASPLFIEGARQNHTTALVSGWPDLDADGNVTTIMATITDVSEMKCIEEQLRHQTMDAERRVKQQEAFVDMVSHEIRNPLSAILHCADEISVSLVRQVSQRPSAFAPDEFRSLVQAADTIAYCAIHQKRIVDDILTLSKLDANLLDVSPLPVEPVELVETALKMFDTQMKSLDMQLRLVIDQSLQDLNVHWLLFDSGRFLQVLINLMTNAVKFTRDSNLRQITVRVAASFEAPPDNDRGIDYVPCMDRDSSYSVGADWLPEDILYLSTSVEDTGKGLSSEEVKLLFRRFSQASPKTQVHYGGSGLGLYISRQLSEMQGGRIGVKSEVSSGTTFVFYVKTCRTTEPKNLDPNKLGPDLSRVEEELRNGYGTALDIFRVDPPLTSTLTRPTIDDIDTSSSAVRLYDQTQQDHHILIVEDNIVNQKVLAKQLRNHKCTVYVANHGEEALAFLKNTNFWSENEHGNRLSVVLMDLEMPIMDGLTCVRKIREFERLGSISGHIPVIAVTANARAQQMKIAADAGMDGVVTKPYRISEVLAKISYVTGMNSTSMNV